MKRLFLCLLALALLLALPSCAAGSPVTSGSSAYAENKAPMEKDNSPSLSEDSDTLAADRKLIKTVRERMETTAYDSLTEALHETVTALGGYISQSSKAGNQETGDRYASYTVRIPADQYDAFSGRLNELGTVTAYSESVEDVTLAYVDIESRITVLEAEETALTAMLASAEDVTTLLAIRSQLNGVQQDLASLKAQKSSLDNQVAYSTVYLTVREVERVTPVGARSFFEEVGDTFTDSLNSLGFFFRGLGVGLLGGFPYILLLGAFGTGIFFLVRYLQRRMKKERSDGAGKDDRSRQ